MRFRSRLLSFFCALTALCLFASASAWAQSYYSVTQQTVGSRWVTIPGTATTIYGSGTDEGIATVTPPFAIPYWGTNYSTCKVDANGRLQFGSATMATSVWSPVSMPFASGSANDGTVCVAHTDLYGGSASASIVWWVDGTAPNRRFIVAWKNFDTFDSGTTGTVNCEAQFGESGVIVLSYQNASAWPTMLVSGENTVGAGCGLDRPSNNTDFVQPTVTSGATSPGVFIRPVYDYQFAALQITGKVLFDRYVTDATGIGNSVEYGLPLSGMTVAQLDSSGATVGTGVTDSAGNFTVYGSPVANGSLAVLSGSSACNVRKAANGALYQAKILTGYDFTAPSPINVGTLTLGEANDPGGLNRAPINIARTIQTVFDWSVARAPTPKKNIPLVDPVLYDPLSNLPTSYTPKNGATTLASMRVAGTFSGNPDPWDASVIRKTYGRHILGAMAADPGTPYDSSFTAVTDDFNAFAEGFGYYINAIISRDTKYFDGVNATTTNVLDMESPPLPAFGTKIAGCIAAALYDLTDGIDASAEPWDTFDGTQGTTGEQVFQTVTGLSTAVSSTTFFNQWALKGYDATALARNFIHHGALVDDGDEPNDYSTEATQLTQFGFVRTNRVLTRFNEDWYRFSMQYPTNVLTVDCVYDRTANPTAVVLLEVQNLAGGVLATGAGVGALGPIEAKTGFIPAGDYFVHVKLTAGATITAYTLQAFQKLEFISGSFQPWTVGRPINVPVNMTGGVPPYTLVVPSPFSKPDGLTLDGVNARVAGTPTGPQSVPIPPGGSYTYDFILSAQDSASPTPNLASGPVSFTVNDELKAHFAPFMAFPFAKPVDVRAPFTGGTPPYTAVIDAQGALPHGLRVESGASMRFTGTPDSPGSYVFKITGTDIAGSSDVATVTGVACVPLGQAAIAPGDSACGFYFDVVKGSTVALTVTTVKTTKKAQPPRALRTTLFDRDGGTVLLKPKDKATKGKASCDVFTAPATGRYFVVVASGDAGPQATLLAKAKIVVNKGGKGDSGANNFVAPQTFPVEVGALAGATLTFTAKPARGSGLQLKGAYLLDPAGGIILFADGEVTEKADGSINFRRVLPSSGTWTVVVGAKPGPQGRFAYSFTVKEPPRAVYSAD